MPLQSRALFAERILHIELIYEPIFDAVSAATLLRLARTCRAARAATAAYTRLAFNIDRLLARFFPSPPLPPAPAPHAHARARAFRGMQARTGTLISGSSALQFFDRTVYPESDLDLYVHAKHRREVGRWLIEEGYAFAPTEHQDPRFEVEIVHGMTTREDGIYSMPGVAAILTFTKPVPRAVHRFVEEESDEQLDVQLEEREPHPLKVQIIVAKNTPMEAILAFHSTCVMNVISYEKAYCLFPRATLEKRLSLLSSSCRGRSKRRSAGLEKYARRGFLMLSTLPPDELELDPASALAPAPFPDALAYTPFLYGLPTALAIAGRAPDPNPNPNPSPARKPWPAFRVGWRWIDDSASWVLPLPLAGIAPPPPANPSTPALAHDPVAVCNWEVRYPAVSARGRGLGRHDPGAVMHFEVATGKVLRYRYLVTDAHLLTFLGRELSARARAEELKEEAELEDRT
ncbi:hypothetical protein TRAPUB_7353 [Trametes pubescens]|uniref:Uncharacterized protein n=1 Tax=Trametes pubescens TaxID=154538 RepID=A0A1M2W6T5_TRAPU|nr:hypothetical protein TRAPUB_7353 [Trametes pubescens]